MRHLPANIFWALVILAFGSPLILRDAIRSLFRPRERRGFEVLPPRER